MKTFWFCWPLLAVTAFAAGDIRIDAPRSGWRHSGLENSAENFVQRSNYPASDVNVREGQSRMALIQGQVKRHAKPAAPAARGERPHTLVVNGVAMPLKVDEQGRFARPYAFGRGANNVEVRSPDGRQRAVAQFYEANPDKLTARVRVLLSWSSDDSDLDLHVLTPKGEHCYYGNRVLDSGGALDVDVTNGYGPEIFASPVAQPGRYFVYVNYYGGYGREPETDKPPPITVASVSVVLNENTVHEKRQSFSVPLRKAGELIEVASFVYP